MNKSHDTKRIIFPMTAHPRKISFDHLLTSGNRIFIRTNGIEGFERWSAGRILVCSTIGCILTCHEINFMINGIIPSALQVPTRYVPGRVFFIFFGLALLELGLHFFAFGIPTLQQARNNTFTFVCEDSAVGTDTSRLI